MFGSDAYLLAQIANGEPDGSTDGYDMTWISPALRPLVERLLAASSNERRAIWDEFLARGFERGPTLQTTPEPERPSRAKFNYFQLPLTSFGRGEMCLRQSLL